MYGSLGKPSEKDIVILFSNRGVDGTRHLPYHMDFCLPIHREGVINGCHLKTTNLVRYTARFPEVDPAKRFIHRCLEAIHNRFHYQDHAQVIQNHIQLLTWAEALPLIKTR